MELRKLFEETPRTVSSIALKRIILFLMKSYCADMENGVSVTMAALLFDNTPFRLVIFF